MLRFGALCSEEQRRFFFIKAHIASVQRPRICIVPGGVRNPVVGARWVKPINDWHRNGSAKFAESAAVILSKEGIHFHITHIDGH